MVANLGTSVDQLDCCCCLWRAGFHGFHFLQEANGKHQSWVCQCHGGQLLILRATQTWSLQYSHFTVGFQRQQLHCMFLAVWTSGEEFWGLLCTVTINCPTHCGNFIMSTIINYYTFVSEKLELLSFVLKMSDWFVISKPGYNKPTSWFLECSTVGTRAQLTYDYK